MTTSTRLTAQSVQFPHIPTQGVEEAVDSVISLLQARLNDVIDRISENYKMAVGRIDLPHIMPSHYYTSEVVEPWEPPACFVIADKSDADLRGQNVDIQVHPMLVIVVIEGVDDVIRMVRRTWRMGLALRTVLRDVSFHNIHCIWKGADYSPIYTRKGESGTRHFRKDVTVRLDVHQYEAMP